MEEQTEANKATNSETTGKIMDVQAPIEGLSPAQPNKDASTEPVTEASEVQTEPIPNLEVALSEEQQTAPEPQPEHTPTNIHVNDGDALSQDSQPAPENADSPTVPEHPAAPHHRGPLVAVIVAIVIALALTGVVIAMYLKSKNGSSLGGDTSSTNSKTTVAKPVASPADVDQATADIDKALSSVDDTVDFAATDISDESLGL